VTASRARHTGADIYQIAKNCRTSVEMIERFYAAHIKSTLDAAAKAKDGRRGTLHPVTHVAKSLGSRPELPAVSSETFTFSPSAPLAGSANRGSAPIPVPKGTFPAWWV
jgi:hypothetical protein